ncbi:MAG: hypothetical protein NVSMB47_09300 [Polyangiales bacterium]
MRPWLRTLGTLALALVAPSCSGAGEPAAPDAALLPRGVGLLIAESTYSGQGFLQVIDPATHGLVDQTGAAYDDDPRLRRLIDPRDGRERLFVVGASDGKLTQIDRRGHVIAEAVVRDPGDAPSAADPLDVAIAPDGALWVTRYFKPTLLVLEPDLAPRRTVDLSVFAPSNGPTTRAPGMSAIAIVDGRAYVALRRLDRDAGPTNDSQIVTLDTTAADPAPAVWLDRLPFRDPDDHFEQRAGAPRKLWISCIGGPLSSPPVSGGIVELDLDTATARVTLDGTKSNVFYAGFDVSTDGLDGYVIDALDDAKRDNPTALRPFRPDTGAVEAAWFSTSHWELVQVAVVGDLLLVADRSSVSPGIQVFDRHDGARLGEIATRLPPVQCVVIRDQ